MKKKYVIANWKMYIDKLSRAERLLDGICKATSDSGKQMSSFISVVVCPSIIHLPILSKKYSEKVLFGAQDVSLHSAGAYTGEVSVVSLEEAGAKFCVIGHSERRKHHGETDKSVSLKLQNILDNSLDLIPIVCIGEDLECFEKGLTREYIEGQLEAIFKNFKEYISMDIDDNSKFNDREIIIAYEPIWAIGSGVTPSADEVDSIHKLIKGWFLWKYDFPVKVIYGGSVDKDNVTNFMAKDNISGVLVGGASIKQKELTAIVEKSTTAVS